MRIMHDACNPVNITTGADLMAGYADGACAPAWQGWKPKVWISSVQTDVGVVGDCEPGNGTVAGWINWVLKRRAAGMDPTIYCADDSLGDFFAGMRWAELAYAFHYAAVPEPHWWICKPGASMIPAGAVAVQTGLGIPPGYDLSLVVDFWPGVDALLTDSEVRERVRTWFIAGLGREPSTQDLDTYAQAVNRDGSNLEQIAISVYDSAEGQAWRAHLQGGAVAPHTHTVPASTTGSAV